VQRHARLQAQGVTAGQPGRDQPAPGTGRGERPPDRLGVIRRAEDLEAVFTGVAGPGEPRRVPGDLGVRDGVVPEGVGVAFGQPRQYRDRGRSLDGDQRPVVAAVGYFGVEAGGPLAQGGEHGPGVGRVGDDQVPGAGEPVDDQVIEYAAVRLADHRVPGPRHRDRGDVADERVVQRLGGLRARHLDLAHVAQVEQADGGAHGRVLGGLAAIAQRQRPAGETGHRRAQPQVHVVQWRRAGERSMRRHRRFPFFRALGPVPVASPLCHGA